MNISFKITHGVESLYTHEGRRQQQGASVPCSLPHNNKTTDSTYNMISRIFSSRLLACVFAVLCPLIARATVYLSWTECNNVSIPVISTDDSSILSGPYRLRAKFIDGSPYGFHAATSYQNNGAKLDSLPPPGTYGVALYWVTYTDYTYSTVAQIGPETDATVTVDNTFSFAMDTTQLAAYALDPQGGLSAFHVIVYLDGGGDILADGAPYSGNYEWSVTGSVSSSGSGNVDLSATGTSGSYSAPEFYYNNSGCFVDVP